MMNKPQTLVLRTLPFLIAMSFQTVHAQSAEKQDTKLPEVQVTSDKEQKYLVKQTSTATKTDTLLRDTPQAITVVSQELIRDQAMQSMADVIRYVPGVVTAQGEGNRDTAVFRGNSSTGDFFVDGIRDDVQYYRDFYNIESVEALKGSNAMIFGRGGSGGVINRVTKQAQWTPVTEASVSLGSWNNRRATVDLGRALDQNFAFRVTGMAENSESYRTGYTLNRSGVNPTLAIRAGENTSVVLGYEHFRDDRTADRGVPSYKGKPLAVDASTFFGNAEMSPTWSTVDALTAYIDHDLGNGVSLRNRTRYANYDKFYQNIYPGAVTSNGQSVAISAYNNATQRTNLFNQTDLVFDVTTGTIKHKFLAGIELGQQKTDNVRNTGYFPSVGINATSITVPLSNPYTNQVVFRQSATDANNYGEVETSGIYVQDQIEWNSQWQTIVGLRRDRFAVDFLNRRTNDKINVTDTPISPRVGLVFKPINDISIYGSYSIAYVPRAGDQLSSLTATNKSFDPEKFKNIEIGAKWDAMKDLSLSAAVYQLDRSNVAIADPTDSTKTILVDGQRAKGVELSITGKITSAWSIMGGYAYQDAKITKTQSATVLAGATLAQVPKNSASLWNRYDLNNTWGLGLGVVYRGEIYPSTDNTVVLPAFTRVDAAAFYNLNSQVRLQLNVENLADKAYYASANSNNNITPGSPRAVRVSANFKF
ncbi:TonB-dependent siderophore receptor [Undibacterium sp. LX40W]|uniref:TonB-dependent siderophore receptor n=1 Tax=Undibacterium nitidum TaxID=2762298 RepID=A0A923KMH1_9BURK|nr:MULTISPECIES: TonB-dependent siderophore receptor [Undibacterium]MBC3882885.1 TonB-dependent siderophore receptor [Undibacterium nitidum]MBC3893166.1 TonB-dependent siderophore receptor [Undibacterium sp. LX40W]